MSKKTAKSAPVISMVNLGCAKNLVDSERILGNLAENGFLIAQDPAVAEVCLVNTCGFINEAREETAGVLNELSQLKETGSLKTLVALGCLVERVADAPELNRFLTAADVRLGFKEYPRISEIVHDLIEKGRSGGAVSAHGPTESAAKKPVPKSYNDFLVSPRLRIGSPHTAFLKIAEGCSNPCRFCSIPRMRGLQVSRPIEKIVEEARELAEGGAQEISLIAQDTTSYGRDIYQRFALADLLRALTKVKGPRWFRLMYAFPKSLSEEMLDVLASDERFCPYIDIPLQHIADDMLSAMARLVDKKKTIEQLDMIARKLPHGAIRTTFIVGFPGETEAHVREVVDFVKEGRFTHAGAFLYSNEPLTPAAKFPDVIPLKEKQARRDAIMIAQREVSRKRTAARIGSKIEVLVDSPLPKGAIDAVKAGGAIARSQLEAPEVDGVVYIEGKRALKLRPGEFVKSEVVAALDYDVIARIV
ncbi:MAG TPA: 30S ribosomal protein S12 methylthiotransferase RimO [Planctomycetota bacterium]|nr:30S ribosomal protein S12 methylthiotransferase RimO [Planctomycetota bacterium]